ncbi:MAG TPA: DUF4032 domain-containing protein [Candidatus Dormibacteraeota bacterium]|nr:DUF4032 domain-containing protein [Candidatus Dormibacteraeota bacterium]
MATPGPANALRLRAPTAELLALPWEAPLETWTDDRVAFVDLTVGPSRHLVRFAEVGGELLALKELPLRPARREYDALRELEARELPAVRPVGLAERPGDDGAILVTHYLSRSFQFRRLFMRLHGGSWRHRERLLDALADLLVDLHRRGVYWGDASLANTLLQRDGQVLLAHLVDAETTFAYERLSDGQRELDLEVAVENVAGELADLACLAGRDPSQLEEEIAAAESLGQRYRGLWDELHWVESLAGLDRYRVEARLRRLNELGFVVDEIELGPVDEGGGGAQLRVCVGDRRFHASRLQQATGLQVEEGQATILLNDLAAWQSTRSRGQHRRDATAAGRRWRTLVYEPAVRRLQAELGPDIDPVQAYCDLLEVRWLLSERAGRDVGDEPAYAALRERGAPPDSAAGMAIAEAPTGVFSVRELLDPLNDREDRPQGRD